MFCTKCGKEIEHESLFCSYCGAENELMNFRPSNLDEQSHSEGNYSKNDVASGLNPVLSNKKYLIPVIVLVLVMLIIVFVKIVNNGAVGATKDFDIKGKWESVGSYGFGQAQPGEIVIFDDYRCNLYSPLDTYTLTKDGETYILESDYYGDISWFVVNIIDNDNIELDFEGEGYAITELHRIG